jgi:thiol-disulfide isomerase/thioredoxin
VTGSPSAAAGEPGSIRPAYHELVSLRPGVFVMRALPVLLLALVAGCSSAESPAAEKKSDYLSVGDPAPPVKAEYWLNGEEVNGFEPGKVYLLDFWATWCGPCLARMTYLDEMARRHKDAGLVTACVTAVDDRGNTVERVKQFVAGRLRDISVPFAVCETRTTVDAYMKLPDGGRPYPTSVVIGKDGKVVYIGTPDDLDEVLPQVLAGTWNPETGMAAIRKAEAALSDILEKMPEAEKLVSLGLPRDVDAGRREAYVREAVGKAATKAVVELDKFALAHPTRAGTDRFIVEKARTLMYAGRFAEARDLGTGLVARGTKRKNWTTLQLAIDLFTDPGSNPKRLYPEVAVTAADALLALEGDSSPGYLMLAAQAYATAGDKGRAAGFGEKALAATPDPRQQSALRQQLEAILQ